MHENFYHNVKVYYEDTDAGGIVYYANYLKYLERSRTEALATIGLSNLKIKEKFGAHIIVKSCNIDTDVRDIHVSLYCTSRPILFPNVIVITKENTIYPFVCPMN